MKKFIVMAAAAALLSGVSFANAQTAAQTNGDKTQVNAGSDAAFCLDVNGTKKCTFVSMAACQKEANGGSCVPNTNKGATTGSGSTISPAASNPGTDKSPTSTMNKGAAGKGN